MTPSFRLWRSSVTVEELTSTGGALSRRGAHRRRLRKLRRHPRHQPDRDRRGRLPPGAPRGAHPVVGDRRRLVTAGAVAAAAQAHGLDQGGLEAARRRQRRDPVQPRNPADRARSCAPGHRGVRQGHAADLLEPAVRRNPRPAAEPDPRRRRTPAEILRFNSRRGQCRRGPHRRLRAGAARTLRRRQRAVPRTLRRGHGDRGARQPHARRRHRHHLHRHHPQRRGGRGFGALQRNAGAARARAHRGINTCSTPRSPTPRAKPTPPIFPRPSSSPPPATTSCNRSTRPGSTSPA